MRFKLLHAIISGIVIATVFSYSLIPTTWQIVNQEPTFEPVASSVAVIGILASMAVVTATLLSFRLMRRTED